MQVQVLRSWMSSFGIQRKVVTLAVASITVTALLMALFSSWASGGFADRTTTDVRELAAQGLSRTAAGVYDVVATQGASTSAKVDSDLAAAQYVLDQSGGFSTSAAKGTVHWEAKNQLSGAVAPVDLPRASAGGTWFGQNTDPGTPTPLVDTVKNMVGATVTVFQRINAAGDMLRVATNVQSGGKRAIGTYIPAVNPDGRPNPVLSSVLAGKTYRGNALVVDSWYVSAYAPITNEAGEVVGIIYVGQKQQNLPALRKSLESTAAGEHGFVEVFGGTTDRRGVVQVGHGGAADGSSALDRTDARGTRYVEKMVDTAVKLGPGEQATVQYVDKATGPHTVRLAYYAPWDWVIATDSQDSDFAGPVDRLAAGRSSMMNWLLIIALCVAAGGALISWLVGRRLIAPLRRLQGRMAEIADGEGDLTQRMDDRRHDEVGELSAAFNRFVEKVATTIQEIGRCARELASSASGVAVVADELGGRTTQSTQRARAAHTAAGEISTGVSTAASGAQQMGASIAEISRSAAEAAHVGRQAAELARSTQTAMTALGASSAEIGDVIRVIAAVAEQTNLLALNATIEAARAGDAGKGFAVVATEVKDLAQEAARASEEIDRRVQAIQADAAAAVTAIARIAQVVDEVEVSQTTIASAVEEQTATTAELTRSVEAMARGAEEVTATMTGVSEDAQRSAEDVERARASAGQLDELSRELTRLIGVFTV